MDESKAFTIVSALANGINPLAELAQAHGRTRGGIQARLVRHGRLLPPGVNEGDRPIGGPGKWRPTGANAAGNAAGAEALHSSGRGRL